MDFLTNLPSQLHVFHSSDRSGRRRQEAEREVTGRVAGQELESRVFFWGGRKHQGRMAGSEKDQ